MRPQLEEWEKLCAEMGEPPADVALAWLLANPALTAPIVGPRTLAQLTAGLRVLEVRLDDQVMGRLDRLFPGPGGPAPEAYPW
jgi:aryl-alcohol dehydrogenase-like predicted oxidoreductase